MCAFPTIGVNDNFTAGKPGIPVRTSNDKFPGGVYMQNKVIIEE